MVKKIEDPFQYFNDHYEILPDGCWQWSGNINLDGYGRLVVNSKYNSAHRFSYLHFKGGIPDGLHLDHLCRNRACVNPDHLEPVTCSENLERGYKARIGNRTHCINGHELNQDTSFFYKSGRKGCLICRTIAQRKQTELKKGRGWEPLEYSGPFCLSCKGEVKRNQGHAGQHTKEKALLKPKSGSSRVSNCLHCGKVFNSGPWAKRKYCSLECSWASPSRVWNKNQ